ncbi:MAG TPA: calcium-binding protein, partial [Allosphingosinicella sp.]
MPLSIIFTNPGTYTIEDDGIRGNNISVIRDSTGAVIVTFAHPSDSLTFTTLTAGVNLIFNVADPFNTSVVTVGSETSASASPDSIVVNYLLANGFVTLVSNGSITEFGSDITADVTAAALVLSAATGVGTAANAIETQVTFLEAETVNGGINISNNGQLQIGGISSNVSGLDVANNGDINLTNIGFIFLADSTGPRIIHGGNLSGNVTLNAIGYDADIFATIDRPVIGAEGGGISLTAGRDIYLGTGGMNYNNDLLATRSIAIQAGRDFVLDGTSNLRTGAFGGVVGGEIFIQAGRNISMPNTNGGNATIEAFQGNVTLVTGPGGTFSQNSAFAGTVQTTNDIFLVADVVNIQGGGLNTTGIGQVTIRPTTAGRAVNLGSVIDITGALSLSDAEFDKMFTLNLVIGDANTGPVDFSGFMSGFLVEDLTVNSASEILLQSSLTLTGDLILRGKSIYQLGASTLNVGTVQAFADAFDVDPGVGGIATFSGTITASSITINGNADADTLSGNGAANILNGLGGNDTLRGFGGNDSLDGGAGADAMFGGLGNDNFSVDNAGDTVNEAIGEGNDTVSAGVSYVLAAGAEIELLATGFIAGTAAIDLTGNEFANQIWGNNGANTLNGAGGSDILFGFGGNDTLDGGIGADTMV